MVLLLFTVQPLLTAVALTAGAGAYRESCLRARLRQHQEQANLQKRCRSLINKLRAEVATLEQLVESQVNSPLSHTFDAKRNILRADNSIILRTECTACSRRSARCRSSRASLPKGGRGGGEGGATALRLDPPPTVLNSEMAIFGAGATHTVRSCTEKRPSSRPLLLPNRPLSAVYMPYLLNYCAEAT